jgi:dolichol-phosphate mannosyltransferase
MEKHAAERAVILIPSLEPDNRLPDYIRRLKEGGFAHIVVVDDGSSESYQQIFQQIETVEDTVVLHHEVNKGKGVALKTGYKYIMENLPDISGVITADADGQHTVRDCLRLAEELEKGERALYLGSRDFTLENIPPKSRFGNRMTSIVFKLLYGQYLPDTQTGLRAFRKEELSFMINVEGERFEYEMKVLIACSRAGIPMIPIMIETIYEDENKGTHFHPIRDSWRIYKVILGSFFKFMASSLTCVAIDQGIFNLLNLAVFANGAKKDAGIILLCTITARVISAGVNFLLNRNFVFGKNGNAGKAFVKYLVLCAGIMLLSAAGTWLLGLTGMSSTVAKLITDTVLYFVSYRFQQQWVFKGEQPNE